MKRIVMILLLLFWALTVWGQTTFYTNPNSINFALINKTLEKAHSTIALCDTATMKFYKTAGGKWEFKQMGATGTNLAYLDSTGALKLAGIAGVGTLTPKATSLTLGQKGAQRDLLVTMEAVPAGTDSSLLITASTLQPTIQFNGTDGDTWHLSIDSSDAARFKNASGGVKNSYAGDALWKCDPSGNNNNGGIYFNPTNSTGTQQTSYIVSSWSADGMYFRLPRANTTHGYKFLDASGATLFFVDSNSGGSGFRCGTAPLANSLTLGNKAAQRDLLITREAVPAGTDSSQLITITSYGDVLTTYNGLKCLRGKRSWADADSMALATGVCGWGWIMAGDNQERTNFSFTSAGVVTLTTATNGFSSANISTTNGTDAKLNIYDDGSGIEIENQLNATVSIAYEIFYYTP
ncbi:MAG: hypothetical protein PHX83_12000 [Acidobacteriia bacterium]|nr:hypothetical protein [Terriglobia bacterium]